MPFMATGTAIAVIGGGLLTTLNIDTRTALSTAFMFIWGAGAGLAANQPFTALQAALRSVDLCSDTSPMLIILINSEEDIPIANGITTFALQLGR